MAHYYYWTCHGEDEPPMVPQFMTKSDKVKKNKASEVGGTMYTCDSILVSKHKRRPTMKHDRPPAQATQRRKDNLGFVNKMFEKTNVDFRMQQHEASSQALEVFEGTSTEASSTSVGSNSFSSTTVNEHIFYEVNSDKNKKGRVYGLDSQVNQSYPIAFDNISNSLYRFMSHDLKEMRQMKEKLYSFQNKIEEMRQMKEKLDSFQNKIEEMRDMMTQITTEQMQLRQWQQEMIVWKNQMDNKMSAILKQSTIVVGPLTNSLDGDSFYDNEGNGGDESDDNC